MIIPLLSSFFRHYRAKDLVAGTLSLLLLLGVSPAAAESFPFSVEISGGGNVPTLTVKNEASDLKLTGIKMDIGDIDKNFDSASNFGHSGSGATITVLSPDTENGGDDSDLLEVVLENMEPGDDLSMAIDFDADGEDSGENYRKILFNNGARANATIEVTAVLASDPAKTFSSSLTFPDGPADLGHYRFESDARPRTLHVVSTVEGGGSEELERIQVRVNGEVFEEEGQKRFGDRSFNLVDGDVVEITVPRRIYRDEDGNDITENEPSKIAGKAVERFSAIGFSVNDVPQTGDPTRYQFEIEKDTDVVVKWLHEFALTIGHDGFAATEAPEKDAAGDPWAGPLESQASGNPEPRAKKHWIEKGETVTAEIDGQVLDFSNPGLDVRYVPTGYDAYGPPNSAALPGINPGAEEVAFQVGQSPPERQQVPEFTMWGPAGITYRWQIQFGIKVNADDPSRAALPSIFQIKDGQRVRVGNGQGTFWFDPEATVLVASEANAAGQDSKALNGWINGDGYYFSSSADVQTHDGSLIRGGPSSREDGSPVAEWLSEFKDEQGTVYRGLRIPSLKRAARVLWRYGTQAVLVDTTIGHYIFQNGLPDRFDSPDSFTTEPERLTQLAINGANPNVGNEEMAVWDPAARRLYPVVPGLFKATWKPKADSAEPVDVLVTVRYPDPAHYPHIAETPAVALDPDANDRFAFKRIEYTENEATVEEDQLFTADSPGHTVLLFSEIQADGRGSPRRFLRVRVVNTRDWEDGLTTGKALIGSKIEDADLDKANLGTGFIRDPSGIARYNPFVYEDETLTGIAAKDVYDMAALRSNRAEKIVTQTENLPGPIIPVNLFPGAAKDERLVVIWYDDPAENDELLWPHQARIYEPRWPTKAEGMKRIVIAGQFGSESVDADGADQVVAPEIGDFAFATTYDPSRFQQVQIYSQPDRTQPGYNPNEEHALIAPSLRFVDRSPRPPAAYALRAGDLNRFKTGAIALQNPETYTSHPRALVQFFDKADQEFKMRIYQIVREDSSIDGYRFADQAKITPEEKGEAVNATPRQLAADPHVTMEAGEPVIPFYPLPQVIGASPCPKTFGTDLKPQSVHWEDHRGTNWAISGGENAWFTGSFYYPLAPDFWWPAGESGFIRTNESEEKVVAVPQTGDCVAFLPEAIEALLDLEPGTVVGNAIEEESEPIRILYKSDWPEVAPVLKAGETLTFQGGEFRADHPTMQVVGDDGELKTVETPGLPGIVGFASAEVVFDSLNPEAENAVWRESWTARAGQVLEKRNVPLRVGNFPSELKPETGRTRVKEGKYIFNDLPASLQRRVRYDPLAQFVGTVTTPGGEVIERTFTGKLEMRGLLNDKDIGDPTLTAAPPAVYILEPNIMTENERESLKELDNQEGSAWDESVEKLYERTRNPNRILGSSGLPSREYLVGLQRQVERDPQNGLPKMMDGEVVRNAESAEALRAFGPGLALVPNPDFLDPTGRLPNGHPLPPVSWVTVVENNDPSLGGSPITPHVIKVDRRERYRGAIKTVLSDNVFDENVVLRHTGDFGANADELVFEWWYRPDDGSLNVPPPDLVPSSRRNPWKLFPDPSGNRGAGRFQIKLKGNPNAPEALLADTWWFVRYRHQKDNVDGTDWEVPQPDGSDEVNFTWAGAGNSDPFNDFNNDGIPDFQAQLAQGWIKRVLDAVNPYEARIRDFEGPNPTTESSMLAELGPRFEGPVALNPDKNVIENVGLIELYETILNRGQDLSIDLSRPISTPAIANALQLASTRISDFYTLLGNEAYSDALDPTIGFGSQSVAYGSSAPAVFSFQNQMASLIDEELALLRGVDDFFARPVYNRLFWNFTKAEGEAAYAQNYNISDINQDGFINEADAMSLYPQGHGDAWGHYLTALRNQYDLFRHENFNWVSRSEFYNLQDIVIKVDFLDERKFAATAAAKAKSGAEIVDLTYRDKYVEDPTAQWQGYTDANKDRSWGVQGWARRGGQGAYFDWVTANALLPAKHPNEELEGIQKVDRTTNSDIQTVSANLNAIQTTFDQANDGQNPLGLAGNVVTFDIDPERTVRGRSKTATHFEQIYERAVQALENALAIWDNANQSRNRIRKIANSEREFRNQVFQEDLTFRNRLIGIFGRPYEGTIGSGKTYPPGYQGPDTLLFMYANVRKISNDTVPLPTEGFGKFTDEDGDGDLEITGGELFEAFENGAGGIREFDGTPPPYNLKISKFSNEVRSLFSPTFSMDDEGEVGIKELDALYAVDYTDLTEPKVNLKNLRQLMPITAAGYSFQAPDSWGARSATGELQSLINRMIRQEADIARAIGAWDGLQGEIIRTMRLINARVLTGGRIRLKNQIFSRIEVIANSIIKGLETAKKVSDLAEEVTTGTLAGIQEGVPDVLPTGGLAVSPGDALSAVSAGFVVSKFTTKTVFDGTQAALEIAKLVEEIAIEVAKNELELFEEREQAALSKKEMLVELENMVGDEPIKRIEVFRQIETLRALSNRYRTVLNEGMRLIDERLAFNKRVAARTQRHRYQDMTFRVSRNHALQTYREALDLAARYAYLAAKAYDYETNPDPSDPGSPRAILNDIVGARGIGHFASGEPRLGKGGLSAALAWLNANYQAQKGQLGFNNPQTETGKISLRTELFRILPEGSTQPEGDQFPSSGADSNELWRRTLENARVPDLWRVPEFRQFSRPFASESDSGGNHLAQPGLVLRFGTQVRSGKNFFGKPLSGSDHAYSPSHFATKIRSVGVWFSDYRSANVVSDLAETPRVYLVPTGLDVMSVPSHGDPSTVRIWNVLDRQIPVPLPARTAELDDGTWTPLLDSLNGRLGDPRRFSSFRAYHNGSNAVNTDELVFDSRLIGRSIWNTQWVLIIPGLTLNADPDVGIDRFVEQVSDIKLVFQTYGHSGG